MSTPTICSRPAVIVVDPVLPATTALLVDYGSDLNDVNLPSALMLGW